MSKKVTCTAAYSLLQASMWGFWAVMLSFTSSYMYHFGYSDSEISMMLGTCSVIAFVLQLGLGEVITRWRKITVFGALVFMGSLMLVIPLIILNPWNKTLAFIGLVLATINMKVIPAMGNAIVMNSISRGAPTVFSVARGFGSVSYGVLSLVTGRLVTNLGVHIISVMTIFVAVFFVGSVIWYHHATGKLSEAEVFEKKDTSTKAESVFKNNAPFTVFLLASCLILFCHGNMNNFQLQILIPKGGNASHQGVTTFLCSAMELPVMFGFAYLLKLMKMERWLQISGFFFAARAFGMFFAQDYLGVYYAQGFQFLAYSVYGIASVQFANNCVSKENGVRAQTMLSAITTLPALISSYTGGVMCDTIGADGMTLLSACVGTVGAIVMVYAVILFEKKQKAALSRTA